FGDMQADPLGAMRRVRTIRSVVARRVVKRAALVLGAVALTALPSRDAGAQPPSSASQSPPPLTERSRDQPWSDSVALGYVERAIARRGEQLADSTLVNYEA